MASFVETNETLAVTHPTDGGVLGRKNHQSVSRVAEADVDAGLFVTVGTDVDDGCAVPTSVAEVVDCLGVTRRITTHDDEGAGGEHYADNGAVEIVYEGFIYVLCEETVAAGDPVFVRYASGAGGTILGKVRNDDPGTEASAFPAAQFAASRTGAGPVLVKVNI